MRYLGFYGTETYIAFIGDSRIRQLYLAFINHLEQNEMSNLDSFGNVYLNMSHSDRKLKIKVEYIVSLDVSEVMVKQFRFDSFKVG